MKKKELLFLIVLSMAFSIMICSCGGGGDGDEDINIVGIWDVGTSITNSTCGIAPETGGVGALIRQDGANVTVIIGNSCVGWGWSSFFHGTLSGKSLQVSKSGPGNYTAFINVTVSQKGNKIDGTFSETGVDCKSSSFIHNFYCCESPESSDCTYEGTFSAYKKEFDLPPLS